MDTPPPTYEEVTRPKEVNLGNNFLFEDEDESANRLVLIIVFILILITIAGWVYLSVAMFYIIWNKVEDLFLFHCFAILVWIVWSMILRAIIFITSK